MIKIGEYVRTKEDGIDKVMSEEDIVNHSKNIIDLIESGDYVNGQKVIEVQKSGVNVGFENDWTSSRWIPISEIKRIVTKEQFSQMEYKVGG